MVPVAVKKLIRFVDALNVEEVGYAEDEVVVGRLAGADEAMIYFVEVVAGAGSVDDVVSLVVALVGAGVVVDVEVLVGVGFFVDVEVLEVLDVVLVDDVNFGVVAGWFRDISHLGGSGSGVPAVCL